MAVVGSLEYMEFAEIPEGKLRVTIKLERPNGQSVTATRHVSNNILEDSDDEEQDAASNWVSSGFIEAYARLMRKGT